MVQRYDDNMVNLYNMKNSVIHALHWQFEEIDKDKLFQVTGANIRLGQVQLDLKHGDTEYELLIKIIK